MLGAATYHSEEGREEADVATDTLSDINSKEQRQERARRHRVESEKKRHQRLVSKMQREEQGGRGGDKSEIVRLEVSVRPIEGGTIFAARCCERNVSRPLSPSVTGYA